MKIALAFHVGGKIIQEDDDKQKKQQLLTDDEHFAGSSHRNKVAHAQRGSSGDTEIKRIEPVCGGW